MFCPKCGSAIPENVPKCPSCGKSLQGAQANPAFFAVVALIIVISVGVAVMFLSM